jgi:hypothetical protein
VSWASKRSCLVAALSPKLIITAKSANSRGALYYRLRSGGDHKRPASSDGAALQLLRLVWNLTPLHSTNRLSATGAHCKAALPSVPTDAARGVSSQILRGLDYRQLGRFVSKCDVRCFVVTTSDYGSRRPTPKGFKVYAKPHNQHRWRLSARLHKLGHL